MILFLFFFFEGGLSRFLWVVLSLYGLADLCKATVALFSTMNSQFTGFLTRLLVISLFLYFIVLMHM